MLSIYIKKTIQNRCFVLAYAGVIISYSINPNLSKWDHVKYDDEEKYGRKTTKSGQGISRKTQTLPYVGNGRVFG